MDEKNPMESVLAVLLGSVLDILQGQFVRNICGIPVVFGHEVGCHEGKLYRIQAYALPQFKRGAKVERILAMSTIDIHGDAWMTPDQDYIDEMREEGGVPEEFWGEVIAFTDKLASDLLAEKLQVQISEC